VSSDDIPPPGRPRGLDPAGAERISADDRTDTEARAVRSAPQPPPRRRRSWWPAALAAATALAGLGIGAALWSGDDDAEPRRADTVTVTRPSRPPRPRPARPAPEAETETEPAPADEAGSVRLDLRRVPGGRRGEGEVALTPQDAGTAILDLTATVPKAQFSAYLVKKGRLRKLLASARDGRLTYKKAVAIKPLTTRYDGIVVVAERLPAGRRTRPVRSLRIGTKPLVRRLARLQAER
jgi:hypothetical protein